MSRWRRRHGEKAEKRPRKFWDLAGVGGVGLKGRVQAGPLPSPGFRSRRGLHCPLEKVGVGWELRGSAKGARGPVTRHTSRGSWGRVASESKAGELPVRRAQEPPTLRGAPIPHDPPLGHSRFCSAKGRCVVVKARKHSFPMSQSSNPGTWPWRLAQKSRCWSFRSTIS